MTIAKVFIIIILIAIIFALFRGLYFLVKHQGETKKTVNSLTWRISLSVFLIVLLILAIKFGLIVPHGVQV